MLVNTQAPPRRIIDWFAASLDAILRLQRERERKRERERGARERAARAATDRAVRAAPAATSASGASGASDAPTRWLARDSAPERGELAALGQQLVGEEHPSR